MRRLTALIAALLALAVPAAAQARTSLVDVPIDSPAALERLERLGLDVTHDVDADSARLLVDDADRRALAAAGFTARDVVADVEAATRRAREADAARARAGGRSALPSGRETYRVLADFHAELDALRDAHPGLVRRVDLPRRSVEGRPLAGVEIAKDVGRADDGRPVYVVMGLHHAREWPSAEVNLEFALDLARGYGTDPRITALLEKVRVYVFPVINPDGFVDSRGELPGPLPGPDPLQRKNAREVDLNRNYGAYWGGNGASTDPASDTYRGPSPWSEPESAAVHEFSQRLHITNFQSIHNIAALVLRPPGFRALGLAPDEERLKLLGDAMGAATGYASEYGYQLYEVTGATEDWNYVAQNSFGYTIELGGGSMFQGPYDTHVVQQYLGADRSPADRNGVREALLLAGEQAADPRDHSVLEGGGVPGATLRLTRTFTTPTSALCQPPYNGGSSDCPVTAPAIALDDGLSTELRVPASGRFEWHVTPSTRPFERKAGRTEAWTLTCVAPDGRELHRQDVVIGLGERKAVDACTPPAAPAGETPPPVVTTRLRPLTLGVRLDARQSRRTVRARGVLVRATCAKDCRLAASVRRPAPRSSVVLGRRTLRLRAGKAVTFRVRLSAAGRRHLARRPTRLTLRLDALAGAERRTTLRRVTLRR